MDILLDQILAIEAATNLNVDGIVMHQNNWKTILKAKDDVSPVLRRRSIRPRAAADALGRRVVLSSLITANTALVGAFGTAAQLFRKGALRVDVSNSHADFFVKNLTAIRAEERIALAVYRPAAFGTVTNLN